MVLDEEDETLIREIYLTPGHAGSFSSATQLQRVLREKHAKHIPLDKIQDWLENQRVYTLHKPAPLKFQRNPIIAEYIDQQWQGDLLFLPDLAKFNDGYNCCLACVDVVSRFAWVEPMKNKTGPETTAAFQKILNKTSPRKPEKFQTDDGKEFFNATFQKLMSEHNINHFSTRSDKKAAIAERFIKTIKEKIYKYLDVNPSNNRFIEALPELVKSYNDSYHSAIKMKPSEVNSSNLGQVLWNLYHDLWEMDRLSDGDIKSVQKFVVGDHVRMSGDAAPFKKVYKGNWTEEIFVIHKIKHALPKYVYKVKDLNGNEIEGGLYEEQLQKVTLPKDDYWQIEEILQEKTVGRKKEKHFLVKWFGYPDSFNSWVSEKDMKDT